MLKIERIFEICNISREVITSMFNHVYDSDSVQIHFKTKYMQIFCRDKINQFLEMYYKNKVFIK